MIYFTCTVCRTQLSGDEAFAGKKMRCPHCRSVQTVPVPEAVGAASGSAPPIGGGRPPPPVRRAPVMHGAGAGRKYGFNCPYCKSRLEANEAIAGTDGQCPTCGLDITIPILDR